MVPSMNSVVAFEIGVIGYYNGIFGANNEGCLLIMKSFIWRLARKYLLKKNSPLSICLRYSNSNNQSRVWPFDKQLKMEQNTINKQTIALRN